MKLAVFSDLHLEHGPDWTIPEVLPDFDVAVVAGDVHGACHLSVATLAKAPALKDKPVLFVPGNHEFYGHILQDGRARGRKSADGTSVHLLWQDVRTIAGVRFIGCTLWTDYELYGTRDISMAVAVSKLHDHRMIRIREAGTTPLLTPERGRAPPV